MPEQSFVELRHIRKVFNPGSVNESLLFDDFDFSVERGQFISVVGSNGSGKTTLLRVLTGTLPPDEGTIRLEGIARGEIGYLPQKPYAFDLSVLQNVLLPLDGGAEAKARAVNALERVGIGHLANARAKRLSGGETQRLALARLLGKSWKLLLLDEPTSAADVGAVEQVELSLLGYARETGCALVYATHAPSQALRLGGRVLALSGGGIAEAGESEQVLRHPQKESTRVFLKSWTI